MTTKREVNIKALSRNLKKLKTLSYHTSKWYFDRLDPEVNERIRKQIVKAEELLKTNPRQAERIIRPLYKIVKGLSLLLHVTSYRKPLEEVPEYKRLMTSLGILEDRGFLGYRQFHILTGVYTQIKEKWLIRRALREIIKGVAFNKASKQELESIKRFSDIGTNLDMGLKILRALDPAYRDVREIILRLENFVENPTFDNMDELDRYLDRMASTHHEQLINFLRNKKEKLKRRKRLSKEDEDVIDEIMHKLKNKVLLSDEERDIVAHLTGTYSWEKTKVYDKLEQRYLDRLIKNKRKMLSDKRK